MSPQIQFRFKYEHKKSAKEERYEMVKENLCYILNWMVLSLIVSFSFFTGVRQINSTTWNMSLQCGNEKFNQILDPVPKTWAAMTILCLILITIGLMSMRMVALDDLSEDLMNIVNYLVGFLLCWEIIFLLQDYASYPIPSFFQNKELKQYYCCENCPKSEMTAKLQNIDFDSRGSFPSFLMCALWYTTTYFLIFSNFLDASKVFSLRIVFFLLPVFTCCAYSVSLWQHNQNHLEDIIVGSAIGIVLATYIGKDFLSVSSELDRFKEDFVTVLIEREIEFSDLNSAENSTDPPINEYTINLYSDPISENRPTPQHDQFRDEPPPYSSI